MDTLILHPADAPDSTPSPPSPDVCIAAIAPEDLPAISQLHDAVFGPGRFARAAYRVREGAPAISAACCKLTIGGRLQGAVQMTEVRAGNSTPGMLLGPLVVADAHKNEGHGQALIAAAVEKATVMDMGFVILVGDLPYYEKAGFQCVLPGRITLPGPVDPARLLVRMLGGGDVPEGPLVAVTP